MPRIVSIWLKDWPIARLLEARRKKGSVSPVEALDPKRPLVLAAPGKGGARIAALNEAARRSGLVAGELLSNARSKVLDLQACDADPAADADALGRLAQWCLRYTPIVVPWDGRSGADGLFLDITGCAHLFGGEAPLLADLDRRLRCLGLLPRLAIADTAGVGWGVAHYGGANSLVVPSGEEETAIQGLPLAALRLPEETRFTLRRLGFRRIRDLMHQPRAPLTARFGAHLLLHLDQALGREPEPLVPLVPPPLYHAQATFLEPITTEEHVAEASRRLMCDIVDDLARDGAGARKLQLLLFRVDGHVVSLDIGLAGPSRDAGHMASLIALRLDRISDGLEAGFGFEAACIHVLVTEPVPERQPHLAVDSGSRRLGDLACLIDRLEQRLGAGAVQQLHPYASHIPERAIRARRAAGASPPDWTGAPLRTARPLLLLPRPEPADVVALVPEGPPRQFRWRRVLHQVVQAEGPERIAPEWWRQAGDEVERDYYVVEDEAGRRFWLYRAGLYDRGSPPPCWFVHGVFP